MILRATFRNILSFNDETSISFVAGKSTQNPEHVSRAEKRDDISVLKSGILYGANASGKSNTIKAIAALRQLALGQKALHHINPFKLSLTSQQQSKIELEFKVGTRYFAYGVELSHKGIQEEWLYEINSRTDKPIFSRQFVDSEYHYEFKAIDGNLETKKFIEFLAQGTPANKSFLSEYMKRNGKGLESIAVAFYWFADVLNIIFPETRYRGISINVEKDEDFASATKKLLGYFNTGIINIRRFRISEGEVDLPREVIRDIISSERKMTAIASSDGLNIYFFERKESDEMVIYKQKAVHLNDNKEDVVFEMDEESDGSIRLLDFIPMLIDLSLNNRVYLIDEIDRSMHPLLSQKLLEYYYSNLRSGLDTQLIFTTHEASLLNSNSIRHDEIWFVEKDIAGASHFTSLVEYKPRQDVLKGYMQGRYGAIPFFQTSAIS